MASYKHGIYISEEATALKPMITVDAPTVVIGCAKQGPVSDPTLIHSMSEFEKTFTFSTDFKNYSLCEAADVFFNLYNVAPVIFINCLDPTKHFNEKTVEVTGLANPVKLSGTILSELTITTGNGLITLLPADFTLKDNMLTITAQNKIVNDKATVKYKILAPSKVKESDIVSGISKVERVYPKLQLVPGTLIAPRWSFKSKVAKSLIGKAKSINGIFKSIAVCDISAASTTSYKDVNTGKTNINLVSEWAVACWPQVIVSKRKYYLSTHAAALMCQVDDRHDGIPYESPSNKILQIDGAALYDKTPVQLTQPEANYINRLGVVTTLNFNGQRLWGNNTSIYPSSSDPKDRFIPIRRMFNYVGNTIVTSFFSQIDDPMNRRLIDSVVDRVNDYLHGLEKRGAIMPGSKIYFLEEENPLTSLADGKIKFHIYLAPPPPAESIDFVLEYDVNLLSSLFD